MVQCRPFVSSGHASRFAGETILSQKASDSPMFNSHLTLLKIQANAEGQNISRNSAKWPSFTHPSTSQLIPSIQFRMKLTGFFLKLLRCYLEMVRIFFVFGEGIELF